MMTSWHGNIYHITGPLCGDPLQTPLMRSFGVFFVVSVNKLTENSRVVGDLRRLNTNINGLMHDSSISIANALEILQSLTKPSIWSRRDALGISATA